MAATRPFVAEALARDPSDPLEIVVPIGYGGTGIASTLPAGSQPAAALPQPRRGAAALLRALRHGIGAGDFIALFAEPIARLIRITGCRCAARRALLNRITLRLDAWHLANLILLLILLVLLCR
jgi:hypothetical protein